MGKLWSDDDARRRRNMRRREQDRKRQDRQRRFESVFHPLRSARRRVFW